MAQPSGGYGFIGSSNTLSGSSGDSSGQWYASNVHYDGPATKDFPYIGQNDYFGEWFSSTVNYTGSRVWLNHDFIGQNDNLGEWFSSTVYYTSNQINVGGGNARYVGGFMGSPVYNNGRIGFALYSGFIGQTWPMNVFVRTTVYWAPSQTTPNQGQLFPLAAGAGGPGQVFPY